MQTQSSDENSVCLSVKHVQYDKMEERSVQIFIPYERLFILVLWEEWLMFCSLIEIYRDLEWPYVSLISSVPWNRK